LLVASPSFAQLSLPTPLGDVTAGLPQLLSLLFARSVDFVIESRPSTMIRNSEYTISEAVAFGDFLSQTHAFSLWTSVSGLRRETLM
jgi:hypothetical protein